MAAHPFGPIENQLIVGYYKRGFDPTRVKAAWNSRNILVPNRHRSPIYDMLRPVFYGWSPANGNSSSHDFRVTHRFQMIDQSALLSRGLGYRITFTMPSKKVRRNMPRTWLIVKAELLDYLGESLVSTEQKTFHDQFWFHVAQDTKLRSLVIEVSSFQLRLVENGTTEYVFPTFAKLSSKPLDDSWLSLWSSYDKYSKRYSASGLDSYQNLLREFHCAIDMTARLGDTLNPAQISQVRDHLSNVSSLTLKVMEQLKTANQSTEDLMQDFEIPELQAELNKLLRFDQLTDKSELSATVHKLKTFLEVFKAHLVDIGQNSQIERLFDRYSADFTLSQYSYPVEPIFWIFEHTMCKNKAIEEAISETTSVPHFASKSFEIFWKPREISLVAMAEKAKANIILPLLGFSPLNEMQFRDCVVPNTDCLLVAGHNTPHLYDLGSAYKAVQEGNKAPALPHIILPAQGKPDEYTFRHHISSLGFSLVMSRRASYRCGDIRRISHFRFDRSSPTLVGQYTSWAELVFDDGLIPKPRSFDLSSTLGAIFQSENTELIYLAIFQPDMGSIFFYCVHYRNESNTLQFGASAKFSASQTSTNASVFWMESKKGRTSNTYACVFTSDRLVSVWVYYRNKFSSVQLTQGTQINKIIPCFGSTTAGLLRYKFDRSLTSGDDCYRFGRLYLKY